MDDLMIEIDQLGASRLVEILNEEYNDKLRVRIVASPG